MKITDQEKIEVQNLIKIIRRAKFDDFQGLEALALARAYGWLESLLIVEPKVEAPTMPVEDEKNTFMPSLAKKPKKGKKNG